MKAKGHVNLYSEGSGTLSMVKWTISESLSTFRLPLHVRRKQRANDINRLSSSSHFASLSR
jgi:hypothetical protein